MMTLRQRCPACHERGVKVCRCDLVLCMVCEERYDHVDKAVVCAVPGCPNTVICSQDFQCYEIRYEVPVCVECINALDSYWRLLAVRRLVA